MANTTAYTDEQVAQALAQLRANGGNAKKTSRQTGVPLSTLRGWAGRLTSETARPRQVEPAAVDAANVELADLFRRVNVGLLRHVVARIESAEGALLLKASVRDLLIGAGIATEKEQLLRGAATSRVEQVRVQLIDPAELRRSSLTVIEGAKRTRSGTAEDRETSERSA